MLVIASSRSARSSYKRRASHRDQVPVLVPQPLYRTAHRTNSSMPQTRLVLLRRQVICLQMVLGFCLVITPLFWDAAPVRAIWQSPFLECPSVLLSVSLPARPVTFGSNFGSSAPRLFSCLQSSWRPPMLTPDPLTICSPELALLATMRY